MSRQESANKSTLRLLVVALVVLCLVGTYRLLREPAAPPPEAPAEPEARPAPEVRPEPVERVVTKAPPPPPEPEPEPAPPQEAAPTTQARSAKPAPLAPSVRIENSGRLSTKLDSLRQGEVIAIALDLEDAARGHGRLPVKVVEVGGRVLETTSVPIPGAGNGLRVEIDPEWLRPGRYLIQVKTLERKPLALRRYFLEVLE